MAGSDKDFAAPGGSTQALVDALRARLAEVLQDLKLPTDVASEPHRAPRIYDGYLPPKRHRGDVSGEFPFVLVRPNGGEDTAEDAATVTVRMVVGTYSEEADGYRDWMAVKERIRVDLLKVRRLAGCFELQHPLRWELSDEQLAPQWLGSIDTTWTIPGIVGTTVWEEIL